MENKKKDIAVVFFSWFVAIVALSSAWVIYWRLPDTLLLRGLVVVFVLAKYHDYSSSNVYRFLLFFFLASWFYRPMFFSIYEALKGLTRALFVSAMFLMPYNLVEKIFKNLIELLACIVLFGIIAHILRILNVFHFPLITTYVADNRVWNVYFLHVYLAESSMRFSSIFDEPGYLGTICSFILAIGGFDLKKWYNFVFFVAGIISLSFAFYAMSALCLIIVLVGKRKIKYIVIGTVVVVAVYLFLPNYFNPILERQEVASLSGGGFEDSRGGSYAMRNNLKIIRGEGVFASLFGNGYDAPLYYFQDNTTAIANSSVFRLIFQMGYLGLALTILFIVLVTNKRNICSLLFMIIFVFSIYQRPQIFEMIWGVFMAYGLLLPTKCTPEKLQGHVHTTTTNLMENKITF